MSARRGSSSTIAISLCLSDASATCYHPLCILTHSSSSASNHSTPVLLRFNFSRIGAVHLNVVHCFCAASTMTLGQFLYGGGAKYLLGHCVYFLPHLSQSTTRGKFA